MKGGNYISLMALGTFGYVIKDKRCKYRFCCALAQNWIMKGGKKPERMMNALQVGTVERIVKKRGHFLVIFLWRWILFRCVYLKWK